MKRSLAIAILASALLAVPAGIAVPTVAIAQAPGCVGDVPAGWLRPGGYCDMLNRNDSIIEEPPNAAGPKVDEHECISSMPAGWIGQQGEAHLQLVDHCDDDDGGCPEITSGNYESEAPVGARLMLVHCHFDSGEF